MKRLLILLLLACALPALAVDTFVQMTNWNTDISAAAGRAVFVSPKVFSNNFPVSPTDTRKYTSDASATFYVSNQISGYYMFEIQAPPASRRVYLSVPAGTGKWTPGLTDWTFGEVVNFSAGYTRDQTLALIRTATNGIAGGSQTNDLTKVSILSGLATNLTVVGKSDSNTNKWHAFGFTYAGANGNYSYIRTDSVTGVRIYSLPGGVWMANDTNSPFDIILNNSFNLISNTNGTPDTWDTATVILSSSPDGTNSWSKGDINGGGAESPQPQTGYGLLLKAIIGDGSGLTGIDAAANGLAVTGGQASTIENPFIHIRTNSIGHNGIWINNTNWIQSGGVSGSMATITNGGMVAYSTNGAFSNVKMFDQLLFQGATPSPVQILAITITANSVFGYQINTPAVSAFTGTQTYTSNWFLIPAQFAATDFTVGTENRVMKMDANNSFHFIGIGNQGTINYHHFSNGTMMGHGIGNSALSGLQMGVNGVYYEIFSAGSNFVNSEQFVLPAETLREAQIFSTNGAVTFQYGLTNIKGGNIVMRSVMEGNGSSISNVAALTATTATHLSTTDSNAIVAAGRQATNFAGATVNLNAATATSAVNATNLYGAISGENPLSEFNLGSETAWGTAMGFYSTKFFMVPVQFHTPTNTPTVGDFIISSGTNDYNGGTYWGRNGGQLTNINASNLASGTLADARLSANVSLLGQTISEAEQIISDNTTANVSASAHGYAPKAPNDATKYLDGTGAYSTPAGSGPTLGANQTWTGSNAFSQMNTIGNGSGTTATVPQFSLMDTNVSGSSRRNWGIALSMQNIGDMQISQGNAQGNNPQVNGTARLIFDAAGNVIIGSKSSAAGATLEVLGSGIVKGSLGVSGAATFTNTISAQTNIAGFNFLPANPGNWVTALATRTTNTTRRAFLEMDISFVDAATGTPVAQVAVEQGTVITNTWICSAPGTIVSTITNHYSFRLTTNAVVTVTDISRGSGASVSISQSQLTSE